MIYDKLLQLYVLTGGSPLLHKLTSFGTFYYADMEVYERRYWDSVQAGSRIDRMMQVPIGYEIDSGMYAVPDDGHVYRIEQAQHGLDADGLTVTTLSLRRMEENYDFCRT